MYSTKLSYYICSTEGHFPKPVIAIHPKTQVILLKGENVTLNCSAASTESQGSKASFQWKKDNVVCIQFSYFFPKLIVPSIVSMVQFQ